MNEHELWSVQDPSKIQTYQTCPRRHFYEYILGWQPDTPSIDLIFGEAWHIAQEILLNYGYTEDAVFLAYGKLTEKYREAFNPVMDDSYFPKNPSFAYMMLQKYIQQYADDLYNFRPLYTEVSGSVSIDSRRVLYFKTDSILEWTAGPRAGKKFSLEHKTARSTKGFWISRYSMRMQVFVYTHVLRCLYGDDTDCVILNASQFQKTDPNHSRFELPKSLDQMRAWYFEIQRVLDDMERDYEQVKKQSPEDDILACFPRNGESCSKWNRTCPYFDFCIAWENPLRYADSVPFGMKVEHWDPRAVRASHTMNLT